MDCPWCRLALALDAFLRDGTCAIHSRSMSVKRRGDLSGSGTSVFLFVCLSCLSACAYFESNDIRRGDQHLAAGKWEEATIAYRQALKETPFDAALQEKFNLARERAAAQYEERGRNALKEHHIDLAVEHFKRALSIEPSNPEHQAALAQALRLKEVLEGIGKAGGMNLIFDRDVRNDPVTIAIEDTPFDDALNLILNSNNLFSRLVSPGVMIVSPN